MLHITIEGTTASLVFMNNGSFTRKNLPYVEAVTLTKGISPVKVIRKKSERFGCIPEKTNTTRDCSRIPI